MKFLRKLRDRLKNRVEDLSVGALIVGVGTLVLGVDIAPQEVDIVVSAAATLGAIFGRWKAARALQ